MRYLSWTIMLLIAGHVSAVSAEAGVLLVSDIYSNTVDRFDATTGAFIDHLVTSGSGGLQTPEDLFINSAGELLVASSSNNRILKYDPDTGAFLGEFTSGIQWPVDMLLHGSELLVTSHTTATVQRVDPLTGALLGTFVSSFPGSGFTHGIAFGPDGDLFYVDHRGNAVGRFDGTTGAFESIFIGNHLNGPTQLAFGPDRNLYVANYFSGSVSRFDGLTGDFIDNFVPSGSGGLAEAQDIVFRDDGRMYVTGTGGVRRYDATTGAFVDHFASGGGIRRGGFMLFVPDVSPVPEPTSLAIWGLGGLGAAVIARGRQKRREPK